MPNTLDARLLLVATCAPQDVRDVHDFESHIFKEYPGWFVDGINQMAKSLSGEFWTASKTITQREIETQKFLKAAYKAIYRAKANDFRRQEPGTDNDTITVRIQSWIENALTDIDIAHEIDNIVIRSGLTIDRGAASVKLRKPETQCYGGY